MSSMQLTQAVTAKRAQVLQIALAVAGALAAAEIVTLHTFIDRWVRRGNIPSWYYWTFQVLLTIAFGFIATRKRVTQRPILFVFVGAGVGYFISFLLSLIAWLGSLGGFEQVAERLRPLGFSAIVQLSLWTPVIVLDPVFGVLPVGFYLLFRKLEVFHRRAS